MGMHTLSKTTEADFDRHFNLNVKGPLFLVQRAVPHMPANADARVIFVSTGLNTSTNVLGAHLLYCATKGAVDQMVRTLSKDPELAAKGITVNAVAPGPTATDLFYQGKTEAVLDVLRRQSPFNRFATPEEIAGVVAFLAGKESGWMSGQVVRVNGANMV
jgi:3-oxoacyl-[acyl-carrier protein] reductase